MDPMAMEGFKPLVICSFVLAFNMMFLSGFTGAMRGKTGTPAIPEDAAMVKGEVKDMVPVELQRVINAHRNALENIPTFLVLAVLYVLSGASATMVWGFMGIFALARWSHSFCYIKGLQPWRSASYGVGTLAMAAMMIHLVIRVL